MKDTTVTAQFEMLDAPASLGEWGALSSSLGPLPPWTLPSNTALCVGPHIDYVAVQTFNPYNGEKLTAVLAESRLSAYFKAEGAEAEMAFTPGDKVLPYRVVGTFKGSDLRGQCAIAQLMPWVKPCEPLNDTAADFVQDYAVAHADRVFNIGRDRFVEMGDCAFRVIPGDYVTTEDGTGIVHIAPTFGADAPKWPRPPASPRFSS